MLQTHSSDPDQVYNYPAAARYLDLSIHTVRRLVANERIRRVKLSPRRVGIRLSELKRYLSACEAA